MTPLSEHLKSFYHSEQIVDQRTRMHFVISAQKWRSSVQYSAGGRWPTQAVLRFLGERLNCQSFQRRAVTNDQLRTIRANQMLFLQITQQPGYGFARRANT